MIWLLSLLLLSTIFTVALTGRYKDQNIELQQKLMDNDQEWHDKMFEVMNDYQYEIDELRKQLKLYRGE